VRPQCRLHAFFWFPSYHVVGGAVAKRIAAAIIGNVYRYTEARVESVIKNQNAGDLLCECPETPKLSLVFANQGDVKKANFCILS
jgi:hypothetical protein